MLLTISECVFGNPCDMGSPELQQRVREASDGRTYVVCEDDLLRFLVELV